uniref:Transposase n=1 Tax=Heterorhabditis bacteriophora TaxID=37862 RepID=A0A1I7WPZ2_HETBA
MWIIAHADRITKSDTLIRMYILDYPKITVDSRHRKFVTDHIVVRYQFLAPMKAFTDRTTIRNGWSHKWRRKLRITDKPENT